jgi:PAS domain S-box-containing protein
VGKTHRELGFTEDLCTLWENAIENVFSTGISKTLEFEIDLTGGHAVLQLQLSPEFNTKGSVNSVIGVSRDITVLKHTQENLNIHQVELQMQNDELRDAQADMDALRLKHFNLYDMAMVAYFTLTESGLIKEANLTAADLLGLTRSDLEKRRFSEFIMPDDESDYFQYRKKLIDTGVLQHCELRMRRQDGSIFIAYLKAVITHDEAGDDVCRMAVVERERIIPEGIQQGVEQ